MKVVAVVSGGMDSVTLAHLLKDEYATESGELFLLSVDYGQRHRKELVFARKCAARLGAEHEVVDLTSVNSLLKGSALTDPSVDVPDGHYAHPSMAATVVPNRNAIMLSIAVGWAVSIGATLVATGVHAGDHPVYPDCRPEFVESLAETSRLGNEGYARDGFGIFAPFVNDAKSDIVSWGERLGVPWRETWSCYKGGGVHCGSCSTCGERREAFQDAGIDDPTVYDATPSYEAPQFMTDPENAPHQFGRREG